MGRHHRDRSGPLCRRPRRAVDLLARSGHDPIDAYLLLSLVGELRVSEIVDAPNWVVTMHVPHRYFA